MFNTFSGEARMVVQDAIEIARDLGAPSVEAEHLLLAATRGSGPVARALADVGLDFDGLCTALVAETTRSLAAVGVTADVVHFAPFTERPKLATSAKLALERALRIALARKDKHIGAGHITLAALQPAVGTVPRALECAGVDRAALISALSA